MASEIIPAHFNRDDDNFVENVAMPLFDLRDSTMNHSTNVRRGVYADPQSQILLSYAGCETDARIFSTEMMRMNVLGLYKYMQAMSGVPSSIGMLLAVQSYFIALGFNLVRFSPALGGLVAISTFMITFGVMFAFFASAIMYARRNARSRSAKSLGFFNGLSEPDHISISPQGINLQWSGSFLSFMGFVLPWKRIALAYMEEHKDEASGEEFEVLCIRDNLGKSMRLDCRLFDSEVLINALQKRAPWSIKAPPMVLAVQPPQRDTFVYLASWGLQIARNLYTSNAATNPIVPGVTLQDNRYTIVETLPIKRFGTEHLARIATQNQSRTQRAVRAIHGTETIENTTLVKLRQFVVPTKLAIKQWYWTLTQFEGEVQRMSCINSNNIARWLDVFMEKGSLFVVTEYDASPTLRKTVELNGCLSEQRVKELALEMCSILNHLHHLEPPYVHRAFTPDALILTESQFLKLNSFQIGANFLPSKLSSLGCDRRYTSPEILNGFASGQADIYSFGGTLYYLLTGEDPTPFQQCDTKAKRPDVSQAFSDIIKRMTDPRANLRIESAAAVEAAILDLANSETNLILL